MPAWTRNILNAILPAAAVTLALLFAQSTHAAPAAATEQVIVDTDIGDDIDDAFAVALLLNSPEFEILGFTTAWGDTGLRAQLLERLLRETGHGKIPVARGIATTSMTPFTQARWAQRGSLPAQTAPAADFLLQQIRLHPGQITLIALGPLTNIGAAIARDPATFRQLKRVVLMGGSVRVGYRKSEYVASRPPDKEYNIAADTPAAQKLFSSGVPIVMMPLDSTQVRLDAVERNALFGHGSALTDALTLLYHQWTDSYQPWSSDTPTLFDVVPVAYLADQRICPTTALRIAVDQEGYTREEAGAANAEVCLALDKPRFLDLFMQRLLQ
ncbi:nucleoside hydrolase [Collimonas pratensis]|uniref:Inosine-uridine preferring nucleoside hydrolase family protein n=1 Tax=Collimonas pratensis TaxID=279113 RepID=A0A127PXU5_9BURK|nr:nucleoside hydrolase [Collimonas pratensis]AMP02617.1 inosine-uridine preferring nucleoside hydrolase family protein [Collimonas pratensis]